MGENTKIEWAHHTFNPWEGCTKVGPGCDHCYAENRNARFAGGKSINWGPGAPRRRTSASNWNNPIRWNADAERLGVRYRVFCASLADVFDNEVPDAWRTDLFRLIIETPHLDWLLLTKRIGNAGKMLQSIAASFNAMLDSNDRYKPLPNVWLGATVVNQQEADRDIPKLLDTPAAVRWLSMEPLLGPVDIENIQRAFWLYDEMGGANSRIPLKGWPDERARSLKGLGGGIDWVVVGGESGPGARPMHPDWARSLRDQCVAAGVPFLFKQWGEWAHTHDGTHTADNYSSVAGSIVNDSAVAGQVLAFPASPKFLDGNPRFHVLERVGKKAAGRLLDGLTWDQYPQGGGQ